MVTLIRASRAGHPFDLAKTRLQTAQPGMYTGAIDVVKKTLAKDGPRGYVSAAYCRSSRNLRSLCSLYRGVVPPLLGVTPVFAISFWVGKLELYRLSLSSTFRTRF